MELCYRNLSGSFYYRVTPGNENIQSYYCKLLILRDTCFYMIRAFTESCLWTFFNSVSRFNNYIICTGISVSFRNT